MLNNKVISFVLLIICVGICSADWLMSNNGPHHWKYITHDQGIHVSSSKKFHLGSINEADGVSMAISDGNVSRLL